jgi:competence protein ComEC
MDQINRNRFPLFTAGVCFAGGILLSHFYMYNILLAGLIAGLLLIIYFIHIKFISSWTTGIILLLIFLGCFRYYLFEHSRSYSSTLLLKIQDEPYSNYGQYKAVATIENGNTFLLPKEKVLLRWKDSTLSIHSNDIVTIPNQLQPIKLHSQSTFDYVTFWRSKGILYQQYLKSTEISIQSNAISNHSWVSDCKKYIYRTLQKFIHEKENLHLSISILIGDRAELSEETKTNFRNSGVSHLLAVSGMHTALLYQLIVWLLFPLGKRPLARVFVFGSSLLLLVFFTLLSGSTASVIRATIMCCCFALGYVLQKKGNGMNTLGASILIILFWQPYQIWDIGFQLSCLAVIGILLAQPIIANCLHLPVWKKFVLENSLITFFAQLTTTPILLFEFHQFSLVFLLSNLLMIPISTILLFALLLILFFDLIHLTFLCSWIGYATNTLLTIFTQIASITGSIPYAVIDHIHFITPDLIISLSILLYTIYAPLEWRNKGLLGITSLWLVGRILLSVI